MYIYDTEASEISFVNNLINQIAEAEKRYLKSPIFYLCITYNCNLRCSYCNESNYVYPGNNEIMTPAQVERAFAAILKIVNIESLQKNR